VETGRFGRLNLTKAPGHRLDRFAVILDTFAMSAVTDHFPPSATVPVAFVRLLVDFCEEQERVLGRNLLSMPLPDPSAPALDPYSGSVFCEQLAAVSAQLADPLVGLKVGSRFVPSSLGALGYVLTTSDSLGDALIRLQQYEGLVHDTNQLNVRSSDGCLVLEWKPRLGRFGDLFEEMGISAFVHSLARLRGGGSGVRRVDLLRSSPRIAAAFEAHLGCAVRLAQDALRIAIPTTELLQPFSGRDPVLRGLLERQIHAESVDEARGADIKKRLSRAITRLAYLGPVTIERAAVEMQMTATQLRQLLIQKGSNFRSVLHEVMRTLAEMHLADESKSIHDVAQLLGYSEHSAFTRAFIKWTGLSPIAFRKRLGVPAINGHVADGVSIE